MIEKAPDAYRTISEVAEDLDIPQHVLRFWETRFTQIRPLKRGGGRRYYRPDDVDLLKGIRHLLYSEGYTIKGVQRILKEHGPKAVQAAMRDHLADIEDETAADGEPAIAPPHRPAHVAPPPVSAPMPAPVIAAPPPPRYAPVAPDPAPAPAHILAPVVAPYAPPPPLAYDPPPYHAEAAAPVAPRAAPAPASTVSFMRGGLGKPVVPVRSQEEARLLPPGTSFGFSVRRARPPEAEPALVAPAASPLRFVPEPMDDEVAPAAPVAAAPFERAPAPIARYGMAEETRRALQSALFELSECRRTIDRVMAERADR